MSYSDPYELPFANGGIEIIHGPEAVGSTVVQQYRKRWIAWTSSDGIRFDEYEEGMTIGDDAGSLNGLFTDGERPTRFSWSFEQDALYAIAFEETPGSIVLRRFVSGVPTEFTWAGISPVLFYNGILQPNTSATDLVALYLKEAGTKIYCRVQRENFGTEHELNSDLNVDLARLIKTEGLNVAGSWYHFLWAETTDARSVVYQSRAYPPPYQQEADQITLGVSLSGGETFAPIVDGDDQSDAISLGVSTSGGVYFDTIIESSAQDRASLSVATSGGVYFDTIVEASNQDSMSATVALAGGTYTLRAISQDADDDKMSLSVALSGGSYSP